MNTSLSKQEINLQISKHFPWCPFCCFEDLQTDLKDDQNHGFILCDNCGAKWKIDIHEKIKTIKLIATSIDWKGKDLLGKETDPKFWQTKAWICVVTRKIPHKKNDSQVKNKL